MLRHIAILMLTLVFGAQTAHGADDPAAPTDPLEYGTLGHTLGIATLRAGAHDESGTNDYFFSVKMYGLLNTAEERNAPLDKRKKIEVDLGTFGETQITSLSSWKADEKTNQVKVVKVDGQQIRELAARVMQEHKVPESDVSVMIDVEMFEKGKKFWFFGEDTRVGNVTYFPIPPTKFDQPLGSNTELVLTDPKGTVVKMTVTYDKTSAPKP